MSINIPKANASTTLAAILILISSPSVVAMINVIGRRVELSKQKEIKYEMFHNGFIANKTHHYKIPVGFSRDKEDGKEKNILACNNSR